MAQQPHKDHAPSAFDPVAIPPPSHENMTTELSTTSLYGVASASMAFNPTGFVNQSASSTAGTLNQTKKYSALSQRSFAPATVNSVLQFQPVLAPSAVPQAAVLPQVKNPQGASKIRAQLGRLAQGGTQISDILRQIHQESITEKDRENPHTKKHRLATILNWTTLLQATFPDLPDPLLAYRHSSHFFEDIFEASHAFLS
jgi:hypothetical protein